jgi:hypothetical protein
MDELPNVQEFRLRIAWLEVDTAATRARAKEAVRESQRLRAESRRLARELREIRALRLRVR